MDPVSNLNTSLNNSLVKQTYRKLFLDGETADVHFMISKGDSNGKPIKIAAHKIILAKACDAFHSMFYGNIKKRNVVKIVDATAVGFKHFLQFFYLDQVELTMESVAEVLYLAEKYLVNHCRSVCEQFLVDNLCIDSICFGYQLSITYNLNDVKIFCKSKIAENLNTVLESDAFLNSSHVLLEQILDIDDSYFNGSKKFMACMGWAERKCLQNGLDPLVMENRRMQLGVDVLHPILLSLKTVDQLVECIKHCRGFFSGEELEEILLNVSKNGRNTLKRRRDEVSNVPTTSNISRPEIAFYRYDSTPKAKRMRRERTIQVRKCEVISFRTNRRLLLSKVSCVNIRLCHPVKVKTARMVVYQISQEQKTLLEELVEFPSKEIYELSEMIVIVPDTLYEIRIYFDEVEEDLVYCMDHNHWEVVEIGVHKITFEKKLSLDYDNAKEGIITSLYFKKFT